MTSTSRQLVINEWGCTEIEARRQHVEGCFSEGDYITHGVDHLFQVGGRRHTSASLKGFYEHEDQRRTGRLMDAYNCLGSQPWKLEGFLLETSKSIDVVACRTL